MRVRNDVPGRPGWEYGTPVRVGAGPDYLTPVYHEAGAYGFRVKGLLEDIESQALSGIDRVYALRELELSPLILEDDMAEGNVRLLVR